MKPFIVAAVVLCATASFAMVVQPLGAASQVLILAAGSTPGQNGLFFRSDITIVNLATHDQTVLLQWLPQVGASSASNTLITINALSGVRSADFVRDIMNQSGLGSIIVSGVTINGAADSTARLVVNARIWTPQPGTNGTTSQSFPVIPVNTINTPAAALFAVGGADDPPNYRVNVGLVNLDPNNAQAFFVNVGGSPAGQKITLPPMTMQQILMGTGLASTAQISVQNQTPDATRSNLWSAYSSTINNITGDAWSELAVAGASP